MNWFPKQVNAWIWITVMSCAANAILDKKKIGWEALTVSVLATGPENVSSRHVLRVTIPTHPILRSAGR